MQDDSEQPLWRIGELSRRVGVSATTLRAWERRYGLLRPGRTAANYRLYSPADARRVRRVLAYLERGLSTAVAARRALADDPEHMTHKGLERLGDELLTALERLDERAAQRTLDDVFALVTVERAIREVVLPTLRVIGERWARNEITVAEEHYATNLIQARLQALAAGWVAGPGAGAVLACAPGELHSIGLACHALAMRSRGWSVFYLGQDTPVAALERTAQRTNARVVVIAASLPERLVELTQDPPHLPAATALAVGGAGASEPLARRLDALLLDDDPLAAADRLTEELR